MRICCSVACWLAYSQLPVLEPTASLPWTMVCRMLISAVRLGFYHVERARLAYVTCAQIRQYVRISPGFVNSNCEIMRILLPIGIMTDIERAQTRGWQANPHHTNSPVLLQGLGTS